MSVLRLKLHGAKSGLLLVTPASDGHFLRSGASIDGEEEGAVFRRGGADFDELAGGAGDGVMFDGEFAVEVRDKKIAVDRACGHEGHFSGLLGGGLHLRGSG